MAPLVKAKVKHETQIRLEQHAHARPQLVWREVQRLIPAATAIMCLSANPASTTASFLPAAASAPKDVVESYPNTLHPPLWSNAELSATAEPPREWQLDPNRQPHDPNRQPHDGQHARSLSPRTAKTTSSFQPIHAEPDI